MAKDWDDKKLDSQLFLAHMDKSKLYYYIINNHDHTTMSKVKPALEWRSIRSRQKANSSIWLVFGEMQFKLEDLYSAFKSNGFILSFYLHSSFCQHINCQIFVEKPLLMKFPRQSESKSYANKN